MLFYSFNKNMSFVIIGFAQNHIFICREKLLIFSCCIWPIKRGMLSIYFSLIGMLLSFLKMMQWNEKKTNYNSKCNKWRLRNQVKRKNSSEMKNNCTNWQKKKIFIASYIKYTRQQHQLHNGCLPFHCCFSIFKLQIEQNMNVIKIWFAHLCINPIVFHTISHKTISIRKNESKWWMYKTPELEKNKM